MDKNKIISLVLLVIILGVGFVAYRFYDEDQKLSGRNMALKKDKARLVEENSNLKYRYGQIEEDKKALEDKLSKINSELDNCRAKEINGAASMRMHLKKNRC